MSILPSLLRSLILTGIFSALIPVIFIGLILVTLVVLGYIPNLDVIGNVGVQEISHFLAVFGSGSAIQGMLTISGASSLVGVLFDSYTFYCQQDWRNLDR